MSVARRSLQVVAFICTLLVGVTSMAVIVTQTTWFKEWLRGFIVRQAEDYVNGRLSIGRLDGNLFTGIELGDIDVTMNGKHVVDVDQVGVEYDPVTLIKGDVVLDHIRLDRPKLVLERTTDGWNLAHLIKARTPDNPNRKRTIEIGEIGISDGSLELADAVGTSGVETPAHVDRLDASVSVRSSQDELKVDIAHVSFRAKNPDLALNALSGTIRRTADGLRFDNVSVRTEESSIRAGGSVTALDSGNPNVDVTVSSDKLTTDEIGRVVHSAARLSLAARLRDHGQRTERSALDGRQRARGIGRTHHRRSHGRRARSGASRRRYGVGQQSGPRPGDEEPDAEERHHGAGAHRPGASL